MQKVILESQGVSGAIPHDIIECANPLVKTPPLQTQIVMSAERLLEQRAVNYAIKHGIYTRKFTSPSNRAVPDRVFIANGNTLFLEFKAYGKRPTEAQLKEIYLINAAGGLASWVDTFSLVEGFLDKLKRFNYGLIKQCCEIQNQLIKP
tara:strand:- start:6 stop:452 length:447 start_codon:yes stop_codon:yes gene_type:complete